MKHFSSKVRGFLAIVFLAAVVFGVAGTIGNAAAPQAISFVTSSVGSIFYTMSIIFANGIQYSSGICPYKKPIEVAGLFGKISNFVYNYPRVITFYIISS